LENWRIGELENWRIGVAWTNLFVRVRDAGIKINAGIEALRD
jgi:hypothetical protein